MSVITDDGVNLQTIEEATKENTTLYSEFTGDIDVSPTNAAGEQVAITSEMDVRNQQLVADGFTQGTVPSATGQNLDNIAKIKNQQRLEDRPSLVYIEILGTNGIKVPKDTETVSSFNDEKFITEYEVEITGGIAYVSAVSENIGVECPASTISLVSPIVGVSSVTNNTAAIAGGEEEGDGSLRTRLQTIGSPFTINLKEGLFLALFEVPNVVKVKILDNNTLSPIDGVPGKNFSPVVLGGNNASIADVVFKYMGVGNPSFGDVSQLTRSEITGDTYTVAFNRPIELLMVVGVTIGVNADFNTSTGKEEIKNNIVDYFATLDIGEDLLTQKIQAVCLINGVESATVLTDGTSVNKFSSFKEIFVTNLAQITVT